jgi:hypothetical protein
VWPGVVQDKPAAQRRWGLLLRLYETRRYKLLWDSWLGGGSVGLLMKYNRNVFEQAKVCKS